MKLWRSSAAALLLLAGAVGANATSYTITFTGATYDFDPVPEGMDGPTQMFGGSLTLETAGPITSPLTTAGTSCSLNGPASAYLSCGGAHEFDPNGYNTGLNFVGFEYGETEGTQGGSGFLWFAPGSFTTEGVHDIYTGSISDGTSAYGNFASAGTLVVSGVPEPSAMLMLLAGLGVVAAMGRRRA